MAYAPCLKILVVLFGGLMVNHDAFCQAQNNCTFNTEPAKFDPSKYFTGTWYELQYAGSVPVTAYYKDYRQDFKTYNQASNKTVFTQSYRTGTKNKCVSVATDQLLSTNVTGRYNLKETIGGRTVTNPFWILFTDYKISVIYGCNSTTDSGTCTNGSVETSIWSRSTKPLTPVQNATISKQLQRACIQVHLVNTDHSNECGAPGPRSSAKTAHSGLIVPVLSLLVMRIYKVF